MLAVFFAAFLLQATYIDLYDSGQRYLQEGQYREAEQVLKSSAAQNPSYVPALKALAQTYVKLKRFPEAMDQYKLVIGMNPRDVDARAHLAELYSWTGDHDKAIVAYREALEIDPESAGLKTGLAKVLRWSHRYDEAARLYREVLERDPEHHEAMKGLAKTHAMTGDLPAAAELLTRAVARYPDDPELHKELGTVLGWQKDYKGAVAALEKALSIAPKYTDALRTLGDVHLWSRSFKDASDAYRRALDIEPDNIENHLLLARLSSQSGDKALAEDYVKSALRIDPADARALDMLRELRGTDSLGYLERLGDIVEFAAFIFVFVLLFFAYRTRRRMLLRRHRLYRYFINFVLPALVLLTFASFLLQDRLSALVDHSFIEDMTEAVLFFALGTSLLALLWAERRSHEFMKTVILAVGAHPDDIELGCGGTIMKAKDSGAIVYGITMTKGEKGAEKAGRREEELKRAARFMEFDGFWVLDFPDTELHRSVSAMKDAIEEKIKETGATLVLTHTEIDIHTDHQSVFEATKVAARNCSILCYEDVSTPREFVPNYFVDVTGYIEDKMWLVSYHKTQVAKTYMDPEVVKGRAAHRGVQAGAQYAEAFRAYKLLR